jgi:hypothetical protein
VDQLKVLGRQLRPQTAPDSAVGWLAEHRACFVHPAAWRAVAVALAAAGRLCGAYGGRRADSLSRQDADILLRALQAGTQPVRPERPGYVGPQGRLLAA